MKKLLVVSLIALASAPAFADKTITGTTAPLQTTVTSASDCTLLSADVKINSSVSNSGYINCNTSTANIGVAFTNTNGKFMTYSAGSAGGGITATGPAATSAAAVTAATTDATAKGSAT